MRTASIKSSFVRDSNYRFEGKYYLNDNSYLSLPLEQNSFKCIELSKVAQVFNPSIFKRQFCKDTPRAVQYFQSSNVNNVSETSSVFVNKKQAEELNLLVKRGDILVTGFGTIGNIRIVSRYQDGVCYANNVCRVQPYDINDTGFLYAFLSSKYGYAQLNKNASGSVVRYIEAPGIKRILIPLISSDIKNQLQALIAESSRLREEAYEYNDTAISLLDSALSCSLTCKKSFTDKVSIKDVFNSLQYRIDPPALINDSVSIMHEIIQNGQRYKLFKDTGATVYRPGIFKRCYVENGYPYIKGSEIFSFNPFKRCECVSKTKTPFVDEMTAKEGQIMLTCAGSVGLIKLITKEYEDKGAITSQDIIRIECSDKLFTKEYLYTYLRLPFVQDYIQSMKYGSVIERIEPFHIESIPVVEPTKELSEEVTKHIKRYMDCTYEAFLKEEEAVNMIESEIEKWNN